MAHSQVTSRLMLGLAACAAMLCAVCVSGCKVVDSWLPSDSVEIASQGGGPAPIDSASTRGLEIRLWVVDDTDWTAARALHSYVEDSSLYLDEQAMARWSDWGFRLVALPVDEVQGFLDSLRSVQPANVQWLGEFGRWRAIVRAGQLKSDRVRVGGSHRQIPLGRPRLIARSWVEPGFDTQSVVPLVRVDLGMQIETKRRPGRSAMMEIQQERTIEDFGPVIDELLLSVSLDGTHAVVVLGEMPGVNWNTLVDPALIENTAKDQDSSAGVFGPKGHQSKGDLPVTDDSSGSSDSQHSSAPSDSARTPNRGVREPSRPMGRSLGELMLTSPGSRVKLANSSRVIPKRVVVVLIPRVDGGYSLLPNRNSSPGEKP